MLCTSFYCADSEQNIVYSQQLTQPLVEAIYTHDVTACRKRFFPQTNWLICATLYDVYFCKPHEIKGLYCEKTKPEWNVLQTIQDRRWSESFFYWSNAWDSYWFLSAAFFFIWLSCNSRPFFDSRKGYLVWC